tara:strand:+ start:720 stop:863 length:144 start_codon:yes stop_codon:yes gene_type:complete
MVLIDNCLSDKLMVPSYFRIILIMAILLCGDDVAGAFCLQMFETIFE